MKVLAWSCVAAGILSMLGFFASRFLLQPSCRNSSARQAQGTLRCLVSAQADFREHDRDGDGRRQYWRKDVSGLYGLVRPCETEMIKLIEVSAAAADLRPLAGMQLGEEGPGLVDLSQYWPAFPKAGYWFAALAFEDESGPELDPTRFAFCAVPESPAFGPAYAVTHDRVLWQRPVAVGRAVPSFFPLDPPSRGWRRVD